MLGLKLNLQACFTLGLISLLYIYYLCWLVYERYGRQFHPVFFLYAPVAFSLPVLSLMTLPLYLLWEASLSLPTRLAVFFILGIGYLRLSMFLTQKILSKRFLPKEKSSPGL